MRCLREQQTLEAKMMQFSYAMTLPKCLKIWLTILIPGLGYANAFLSGFTGNEEFIIKSFSKWMSHTHTHFGVFWICNEFCDDYETQTLRMFTNDFFLFLSLSFITLAKLWKQIFQHIKFVTTCTLFFSFELLNFKTGRWRLNIFDDFWWMKWFCAWHEHNLWLREEKKHFFVFFFWVTC